MSWWLYNYPPLSFHYNKLIASDFLMLFMVVDSEDNQEYTYFVCVGAHMTHKCVKEAEMGLDVAPSNQVTVTLLIDLHRKLFFYEMLPHSWGGAIVNDATQVQSKQYSLLRC